VLRTHIVVTIVVVMSASGITAQELTEERAVQLALSREALYRLESGDRSAARSATAHQSVWANPSLSYLREAAGGEDEETIVVALPLDLGGRFLRVDAARAREAAVESELVQRRLDVTRDVRLAFGEALAAREGVDALTRWGERIAGIVGTVALLEEGGEVSGYDRRRAERERLSVDARLRTERARLAGALQRLAALLEADADAIVVTGSLLQNAPPDLAALLAEIESRPDIRAELIRAEAARLERRAAGRWWIPSAELTAGRKTLGDTSNGSVLGISLGIPIFDRNQSAGLAAQAEEAAAAARREILLARAAGDVRARAAEERELRASAMAFRSNASTASEQLVEIAEVAYRAGEVGILELLDAYRSAVDADTERIDLELRARVAAIELLHAAGFDAAVITSTENES